VLHDQDGSALTINRYIHLNPVRVADLGGHEGRVAGDQPQPDREMIKARGSGIVRTRNRTSRPRILAKLDPMVFPL